MYAYELSDALNSIVTSITTPQVDILVIVYVSGMDSRPLKMTSHKHIQRVNVMDANRTKDKLHLFMKGETMLLGLANSRRLFLWQSLLHAEDHLVVKGPERQPF